MRQQRYGLLLQAIGEKQGGTAGRQYLHDLMDHALRHGQRAVTDIEGVAKVLIPC
jgi:hypothetical protein